MNCLTNFEKHNPQAPLPVRPVDFIKGEFYQFNISVPLSPIPEPIHI